MTTREWHSINRFIGEYLILDIIPLDLFLHFIIGTILTVALLKFKIKHIRTLLIISAIALIKELNDSTSLTASFGEAAEDFLATIIFPFATYLIFKMKRSKSPKNF